MDVTFFYRYMTLTGSIFTLIAPTLRLYNSTTLRLIAISYLPSAICHLPLAPHFTTLQINDFTAYSYLPSAISHLPLALHFTPLQINDFTAYSHGIMKVFYIFSREYHCPVKRM